jgi:hypothetical protein
MLIRERSIMQLTRLFPTHGPSLHLRRVSEEELCILLTPRQPLVMFSEPLQLHRPDVLRK